MKNFSLSETTDTIEYETDVDGTKWYVLRVRDEAGAQGTRAMTNPIYVSNSDTNKGCNGSERSPPAVANEAANDPDCDGRYEDVDGNGETDVVDVQALFANRDDGVVTENRDAFEFNGDDRFDVADVQWLFAELTE